MFTARRLTRISSSMAAMLLFAASAAWTAGDKPDKPEPPDPVDPAGSQAGGHPDVPPMPPMPPGVRPPKLPNSATMTDRYHLKSGETHKGDLYFMSDSVTIAGTQQGDLMVFGRVVTVPDTGTVSGDLVAWVQSAQLNGKMGDAVRVFCQDLRVTGTIEGDLIAFCATIEIEKGAHIKGDLSAKAANIVVQGVVDGDVEATGGEVNLSGQVGGDADLTADVIEIDPKTKITGNLDYTSRSQLELDGSKIVHGDITYSPGKKKPPVSKGGIFWWFFAMSTALLSGLGSLAIFRKSAPAIIAAVQGDSLRSAGVGFITAIVFPVAALLSCIFIITIPAVFLALIAYLLILYLAQVPVAVWLGDLVLTRMGRGGRSHFAALAVGMPLMYLVFSIPYLGKIALFAVIFVGFGAIVVTIWAARQARRAGGGPLVTEPPPAAQPA